MQFDETLGAFVSYDAELNTDKTSHSVSFGIRFSF